MPTIDTTTPLHHTGARRLTVNLDDDLYALAVSLAKAEDCSISAAVNRLLRRSLPGGSGSGAPAGHRNGLAISQGREPATVDVVARVEAEDDAG